MTRLFISMLALVSLTTVCSGQFQHQGSTRVSLWWNVDGASRASTSEGELAYRFTKRKLFHDRTHITAISKLVVPTSYFEFSYSARPIDGARIRHETGHAEGAIQLTKLLSVGGGVLYTGEKEYLDPMLYDTQHRLQAILIRVLMNYYPSRHLRIEESIGGGEARYPDGWNDDTLPPRYSSFQVAHALYYVIDASQGYAHRIVYAHLREHGEAVLLMHSYEYALSKYFTIGPDLSYSATFQQEASPRHLLCTGITLNTHPWLSEVFSLRIGYAKGLESGGTGTINARITLTAWM